MRRVVLLLAALAACGDDAKLRPGSPLIVDTALDFGTTACGKSAAPRQIVFGNDGDTAFTFTAVTGAAYLVTPAAGYVGPHTQVTMTITPMPVTGVAAIDDTLTITTDVKGDSPHTIALTQKVDGVLVQASTSTVSFATARQVGSAPVTSDVTFMNTGTSPTTLTFSTTKDSFAIVGGPAMLAPGESVTRQVQFQPFESGALAGTLHIDATGTTCGAAPTLALAGTGTFAGTAAEVQLIGPAQQRKVSTAICVRTVFGHVACMGLDAMHVRGAGTGAVTSYMTPNLVRTISGTPLDQVVEVHGYGGRACARRSDGSVWCWGAQLGETPRSNGVGLPYAEPVFASNVISFDVGYRVLCGVFAPNGTVSCQGIVPSGWSGSDQSVVTSIEGATQVALNGSGGYVRTSDGNVLAWGNAIHGVRGANNINNNDPPNLVSNLSSVSTVVGTHGRGNGGDGAVGGACALTTGGDVYCWGTGRHGKIGDGTTNDRASATRVHVDAETMLTGVTGLASGRNHRCAIATDNVYCWGRSRDGQLGFTSTDDAVTYASPVQPAITDAVQLTSGNRGNCVLHSDKRITCWGQTPISSGISQVELTTFSP